MIAVVRRPLQEQEIEALVSDIRLYPSLIYVARSRLAHFKTPYVLEDGGAFIGICATYEFGHWVKLGPFVLLKKFHGKGYGKILLTKVVGDYAKKNIYVTSSHIAVQKIIEQLGFKEIRNVFSLPFPVKLFLLKQLHEHLHWDAVIEFMRKKLTMKSGVRKYYIKHAIVNT